MTKEDLKEKLNADSVLLKEFEEKYRDILNKHDELINNVKADEQNILNDVWMVDRYFKFERTGDTFYFYVKQAGCNIIIGDIIRDISKNNTCGNYKSQRIKSGGIQRYNTTNYEEITKAEFEYLWNLKYRNFPLVDGYWSTI